MNKKNKLISIAMATYNGEKYLREQLDSIYAQTYKNIEVIVCDDCSSDKTVEILEEYSKNFGLHYFVNETNLGFVKNFEKAIGLCSGDYIALSDQDDIWEKSKLERLLATIGDNLLIHSDCMIVDAENNMIASEWKKETGHEVKFENLLFRNVVTGCTMMFSRELSKIALPFPPGIIYHDWWLAVCATSENKICYLSDSLVRYRQHGYQDTGMVFKIFFLKRIISNIVFRLRKKETIGLRHSVVQKKQLSALLADGRLVNNKKNIIEDIIRYFNSYSSGIVHIRSFQIGVKYSKYLYPQNNFLYIKNIVWDIIG